MDKNIKILVVDDDVDVRTSVRAILEAEGYAVDLAGTGNEALQKTDETYYNAALIDIRLPDMEGTKLLGLMREVFPKTRKIIMTGYPSMQYAITALNRGADFFLIKPVDIDFLLATLAEQLLTQEKERRMVQYKMDECVETQVDEASEVKVSSS